MIALTEDRSIEAFRLLSACEEICNFTTTRHGGVSKGNYASFNLGIYGDDDPECLKQNMEKLCSSLPQRPKVMVIPHQAHGTEIEVIDEAYVNACAEERQQRIENKDALITREKGVCLCVTTADCIPLLFYDKAHGVVATAHAGWRGTVGRIALKTLQRMHELYGTEGKDVLACMGPGISLAGFEVGDEVYLEFANAGFPMERISEWKRHSHKYHINLWIANMLQFNEFGIPDRQIELSGICTYLRYQDYFSARRMGTESGRALTGIMLRQVPQQD